MAFPTSSVLDTFTDASAPRDLPSYNANWVDLPGFGHVSQTITGGVAGYTAGFANGAYWTANSAADSEVFCTKAAETDTFCGIYLFLRLNPSDPASDFYRVRAFDTGAWQLVKVVSFSQTQINTATQLVAVGDSMGLSAIGNVIEMWYKPAAGSWTSLGAVSDSGVTAAGYQGFHIDDNIGRIDNFGGGAYVAPAAGNTYIETGMGVIG